MNYHIVKAIYISDYKVKIKFKDGREGIIDFSLEFDGPIFEPLKSIDYFKHFFIQGHTIAWENGADFAPEYLYEKVANTRTGVVT